MGTKLTIEAEASDGLKSSPKLAGRRARATSTFGDAVTAVLLQTITGQGSQDGEQHPDETNPADQAVQARNPTRAAMPTTLFRAVISRINTRTVALFRFSNRRSERGRVLRTVTE